MDERTEVLSTGDDVAVWDCLSFLAAPDDVSDWRMVLLYEAALEAGVLSNLPAPPEVLAERLHLDPQTLRLVMDALRWWNVVEVDEEGRYAMAAGAPGPRAATVLRHHARAIHHWSSRVGERLTSGPPKGGRRGIPVAGGVRSGGLELWLDALAVNARTSAPRAVDRCLAEVSDARRVLDLGGGHGEYALEFARRGLHATMQDRPEVVELVRARSGLAESGVDLFAGDFFEVLPSGWFDVIFCAGVTYTFDAQRNLELFAKLRPAVAPGGALAILTFLRGADPIASLFAVQIGIGGTGADTHSEDEYREWLNQAGFASMECLNLERPGETLLLAR